MKLHLLSEAVFRSNPAYELKELGALHQPELTALAGSLLNEPDVFGVFAPCDQSAGLPHKLAYKDVALLFYFLQQPAPLPAYLIRAYDDELNTTLAKLVMENVLQIEHNGSFACGAQAFQRLYKREPSKQAPASRHLEILSHKAVEWVLRLQHVDLLSVHARLYCYNAALPQADAPDLQTEEQLLAFLGIRNNPGLAQEITRHWHMNLPTEEYNWLSFARRKSRQAPGKNKLIYKLYISPWLANLPEAFQKSVSVLNRSKAFSFKTGTNRSGLLRPDKFVVYFHTFKDLEEAAAGLKEALAGIPAQGVPFTAQLDDAGLLSWGIDPPRHDPSFAYPTSWRSRVTEKLAAAVLQAKEARLGKEEAHAYVMNKIFLERIDPYTWTPKQDSPHLF